MFGLIHIYCGNGKGKTTAATGLAVRAAGFGKKVIFTQFFKNGSSCEIKSLKKLENISLFHCETPYGLFSKMTEEEKESAKKDYSELLERALSSAEEADLLVLDEAVSSCNYGIINEERLCEFLENKPKELEVVLTGRHPSEKLLSLADYVTEMKKIKHPYDEGIGARKGIEF
ncbi:MAG: cob(I)yrinic acid a,c-diamide adenosyltransferase [Oscillospiraceae bacterium]|nr:cob(I)yrinic acid a,c-diamide adenosyltransferase [Oscillospiraceae bacterium]